MLPVLKRRKIESPAMRKLSIRQTLSRPPTTASRPDPTSLMGIVEDSFADPDFGPTKLPLKRAISLRYLQKLFIQRGSTCSDFIYSLRLDHAAPLVNRRASLRTNQPLSEIAYACGFPDYTHSHEDFDSGSVTPQATIQENLMAEAIESCAPIPAKVRHWLATPTSRAI